MTVRIELGFDDPPADAWSLQLVPGAVRVFVDDDCLTAMRPDGPDYPQPPVYDADGERVDCSECPFVGERVTATLAHLEQAVLTVARGEYEDFEPVTARVSSGGGNPYVFVLSRVDEQHLRMAFQHSHWNPEQRSLPRPTLASARGYLVSIAELCAGTADAIETYCVYLERAIPNFDGEGQCEDARSVVQQKEPLVQELRTHEQRYH